MTTPYRVEGITDFSFDPGALSHESRKEHPLTFALAGVDGLTGAHGASGRTGSSGTRNSDGTQGAGGHGGDGSPGGPGFHGTNAMSAALAIAKRGNSIVIGDASRAMTLTGSVFIDARGGHGGGGGRGGAGGSGGSGSPSGSSGSDGRGGDGGDGGHGGTVSVYADHPHLLGFIAGIDTSGGHAGAGGSGSPSGRSGSAGADGSHVLTCNGLSGTRFGLRVTEVALAHDGTARGRNLARGSELVLGAVEIRNQAEFSVPAPFIVRVSADTGIDLESAVISNLDRSFSPGSAAKIECAVRITVRTDVEVGHYQARISIESEAYGVPSPLDENHKVASFDIAVNHRVPDSALAALGIDDQRAAHALLEKAHAMSPEAQSPYLLAALVKSFAPSSGLTKDQEEAVGPGMTGALLSADRLFKAIGDLANESTAACETIGADFVKSLGTASKAKALDLVLVLLTADQVLSAAEKSRLREIAQKIEMPSSWLEHNVPQAFTPGDTKVGSGASNRAAAVALPFLLAGLSFATSGFLVGNSSSGGAAFGVIGATAIFGFMLAYPILFRTACPRCASIRVEPVTDGKGALTGSDDDHRCTECGARGTRKRNARAELSHSSAGLASHTPWKHIYGATFLVAAAMALRFYFVGAEPASFAIGCGGVLALAAIVSFLLFRARSFPWISSVLALVLVLIAAAVSASR